MNWKSFFFAACASVIMAIGSTWKIQDWRWHSKLANQASTHMLELSAAEQKLIQIKDETARQLVKHQETQREQASRLTQIDAHHYQELRRAQSETDRLRADLADGSRRLSVRAVCKSGANNSGNAVPIDSGTARLDDGAVRAELHPEVAGRIIRIIGNADECSKKLTALQQWVSAQKQ